VQRAWVEARIPDWRQIAPELALRAELAPGLLLVAREHPRSTRIAARAAAEAIRLVRWSGAVDEPDLEMLEPPPRPRRAPAPRPLRLASVFRTSLTDADLAS